jgi:rhodanese-related sulfurtransferase
MNKNKAKTATKKSIPKWIWIVLVPVLILLVAGIVISFQSTNSPATSMPSEISVTEASQKRDIGAFILDVRELSEWTAFHIPGATLIPLGELPNRLNEVPKDRPVVVVCRTGNRSATGRDILKNAGLTNVTSMAGGVTQWQSQGLPIATGQ